MGYEAQHFLSPDGTEMVVVTAAEYHRLKRLAAEALEIGDAGAVLARIGAGEGTMPAEVLSAIIDDALHPVAAWRRHRGMSQVELARRAGVSQVWISRIEAGRGHGTPRTRHKLAAALNAPVWALETDPPGSGGAPA